MKSHRTTAWATAVLLTLMLPAQGAAQRPSRFTGRPAVEAAPIDGNHGDVDTQQTLLEDMLVGTSYGAIAGFTLGTASWLSSDDAPEAMGALLPVLGALAGMPVGAIGGAIVHLFGHDVPTSSPR